MGISFNEVPNDQLVPFVYVEFDSSRAVSGPGIQPLKQLLIGNKLSTGTGNAEQPYQVTDVATAEALFGRGSILADMVRGFKENNNQNELWCVALDDAGGAVQPSGSFAMTGTATEAGEIDYYVGGYRVKVGVAIGDTAADVATALKEALDSDDNSYIPVSCHVSSGTLHLYLKNKGAVGNSMDLRVSYYEGEEVPAGLTVNVGAMASGATDPDVQDAIDVLGAEQYHVISHPYLDTSNLDAMESELENRWGPLTQNDGVCIYFKSETFANLSTLGDARNSPFEVMMGGYSVPTSPWRVAAAVAGNVARYGQLDPARPFQTLELKGVLAPAVSDRFRQDERNLLLKDGIATFKMDASGKVRIERLVTTYKFNANDAPDTSYRDLNTVMTLSYLRYDWRNYILRKYPRSKVANDGTRFAPGQAIVTPSLLKSEAILKFSEWERIGLVEGLAQFKSELVVERNESDPNRIDVLLPLDIVNQLMIVGTQIQFLL